MRLAGAQRLRGPHLLRRGPWPDRGPGGGNLPAGYLPLPSNLVTQADSVVTKLRQIASGQSTSSRASTSTSPSGASPTPGGPATATTPPEHARSHRPKRAAPVGRLLAELLGGRQHLRGGRARVDSHGAGHRATDGATRGGHHAGAARWADPQRHRRRVHHRDRWRGWADCCCATAGCRAGRGGQAMSPALQHRASAGKVAFAGQEHPPGQFTLQGDRWALPSRLRPGHRWKGKPSHETQTPRGRRTLPRSGHRRDGDREHLRLAAVPGARLRRRHHDLRGRQLGHHPGRHQPVRAGPGWQHALGPQYATNQVSQAVHEVITPAKEARSADGTPKPLATQQNCSYDRPNGSGEGQAALRLSINPASAAAPLVAPTRRSRASLTSGGPPVPRAATPAPPVSSSSSPSGWTT